METKRTGIVADRKKAMEIIQQSGVINPRITLGEIMAVSGKLDVLDSGPLSVWCLVGPNFIFFGDQDSKKESARKTQK